jgi:hypothetical protein
VVDKTYPSEDEITFLLCESIRQEANNKLTLIGLFTGGDVLVPVNATLITLPTFGLLFIFKDGEGTFSIHASIFSPTNKLLLARAKLEDSKKDKDGPMVIALMMTPFVTDEIGQFRVEIELDSEKYERTFEVKKSANVV